MARILVFGSLNWDTPIRLSAPLASGGRLFGTSFGGRMAGRLGGGGANTGCGLAMVGHHVAVVTSVPSGPVGDRVLQQAKSHGIDIRFVRRVDRPFPTTLLLIEPHGERVVLGVDLPATPPPEPSSEDRAIRRAALAAFKPDALYLRKVDEQGLACLGTGEALAVAQWPGAAVVERIGVPLSVDALIVSRDDLTLPFKDDLWPMARRMAGDRLRALVVTDGPNGAHLFTDDGRQTIPTPTAVPVDCTGAGDAFAAGFIRARLAGVSWPLAVQHANAWGALTVADHGSLPPPWAADLTIT
ncbi:MAG: carbohydrate kinase family protein [Alphaproteobacteria bacterium]